MCVERMCKWDELYCSSSGIVNNDMRVMAAYFTKCEEVAGDHSFWAYVIHANCHMGVCHTPLRRSIDEAALALVADGEDVGAGEGGIAEGIMP
jgi:hypothetical protein